MDIMFKNYDTGKTAYLPVVPPDIEIVNGLGVEEIDTLDGKITKINNRELVSFSIDSIFPCREYSWTNKNANMKAFDYVNFFKDAINKKQLLGVHVITKDGFYMLSIKCNVVKFSFRQDKAGDVGYSMEIKEYRDVKVVEV